MGSHGIFGIIRCVPARHSFAHEGVDGIGVGAVCRCVMLCWQRRELGRRVRVSSLPLLLHKQRSLSSNSHPPAPCHPRMTSRWSYGAPLIESARQWGRGWSKWGVDATINWKSLCLIRSNSLALFSIHSNLMFLYVLHISISIYSNWMFFDYHTIESKYIQIECFRIFKLNVFRRPHYWIWKCRWPGI